MRKHITKNLARLAMAFALVLTGLPVATLTAGAAFAESTNAVQSAITGDLTNKGDWIAYSFPYAGDSKDITITLTYSPADQGNDQNVVFQAYSPSSLPPSGTAIAAPQATSPGTKTWVFSSSTAGNYVVMIQNWDALGRSVHYSLTSKYKATGEAGPGFTVFSSAANVTAGTAPTATVTTTTTTTASSNTSNTTTSGTSVSGDLTTKGSWIAYTMNYTKANEEAKITLNYSPFEESNNDSVILNAYKPSSLPPGGTPIGSGSISGSTKGIKYWTLNSGTTGSYVLLIQNWDTDGRPVHYTLTSSYTNYANEGPTLTLLSSGN